MPATYKDISQRLGKVIKDLPKLKDQEGVFDNFDHLVGQLEEEVNYKIEKMAVRKAAAERKEEERAAAAAEAERKAQEQADIDAAVEARAEEIEAENETAQDETDE